MMELLNISLPNMTIGHLLLWTVFWIGFSSYIMYMAGKADGRQEMRKNWER